VRAEAARSVLGHVVDCTVIQGFDTCDDGWDAPL
jgi:hypothetical protein